MIELQAAFTGAKLHSAFRAPNSALPSAQPSIIGFDHPFLTLSNILFVYSV
jgi:hypothetical protein